MKLTAMLRWVFLLLMSSQSFGFSPGLTIPKWYQGSLRPLSTPELGQEFELKFEFQPLLAPIEYAQTKLILPAGLKALKGSLITSVASLPLGTSIQLSWTLKAEKIIQGRLLSLEVKTPYPIMALKKESLRLYGHEPKHQRNQLLKHLQNMRQEAELSFHQNLMILETEGILQVSGLIFSSKVHIKGYENPFLTYSPQNSTTEAKKTHRQEILEFEKFFTKDLKEPPLEPRAIQSPTPGFQRALQKVSFLYYEDALQKFHAGAFAESDQKLQTLSAQLLREPEMNYSLFMAIQNLRALALSALDNIERAKQIWITTIRTAADSPSRHYLMYNLAILLSKAKNPALSLHYLNEAVKSQPGFTLARSLREKLFQN